MTDIPKDTFFYGIPTYKRVDHQKTLAYLHNMGVERERIYLSTQNEEEFSVCKERYSGEAVVVFGKATNVAGNRNTILTHAPRGAWVVFMDDDIRDICFFEGSRVIPVASERVEVILGSCIKYAMSVGAPVWGVYPVDNAMFGRSNGTCTMRAIVIGTLMGVKNDGLRFNTSYTVKEDYELCARVLERGQCCVRFNNITVRADHYSCGGCEDAWKSGVSNMASLRLVKRYPSLLGLVRRSRGGGRIEVRRLKSD